MSLSSTEEEIGISSIRACDIRYYGDGCLGCNQREKSCYYGCIKGEMSDSKNVNGLVYGYTGSNEKFIGCVGGCGGCIGTSGKGESLIKEIEYMTGVE